MGTNSIFLSSSTNQATNIDSEELGKKIGRRGMFVNELSNLGLPIAPAVILPSDKVDKDINKKDVENFIEEALVLLEKESNQKLGSDINPLFCKVLISPDFDYVGLKSVHNVGLTSKTVTKYVQSAGKEFVEQEWKNLLELILNLTNSEDESYNKLKESLNNASNREKIDKYIAYDNKLEDPIYQFTQLILFLTKDFYKNTYNEGLELSFIIQMMVFGNFSSDSITGRFITRDNLTGLEGVKGEFAYNDFSVDQTKGKRYEINELPKEHLKVLMNIAKIIEENYKEIRRGVFVVQSGQFWLIDQKNIEVSTVAQLRFLLDLHSKDKIDDKLLINHFQPRQLQELVHSKLNKKDKNLKGYKGGISGSPGAAVGRVYFSTPKFLKSLKLAKKTGQESDQILAMESTFAEDVQAIEFGQGVISSEGGFSSHAPVVARSLGKPSLIIPELKFGNDFMELPDKSIVKEGDYISMEVDFYEKPIIYQGKLGFKKPDIESNGLSEFTQYLKKKVNNFEVRCNADQAKDMMIGKKLGASGVGLCRTEHMFFAEERIMRLRQMLLLESVENRKTVLTVIKGFLKKDFIEILEALDGDPLTVRLLDAPLHEFIPKQEEDIKNSYNYMKEKKWIDLTYSEVQAKFKLLSNETNPMLGHRGCRIAITYPEIYAIQAEAILEAGIEVSKAKKVKIELMIPMVTIDRELDFIINGKDIEGIYIPGLLTIEKKICNKYEIKQLPFEYKIGTMIELPGAALSAHKLANYASFFSFGTNDLTQTTLGMSRDDINSFYADYSKYDLFETNPFQKLDKVVKELIRIATKLGKMVRPDMKIGLCGEQGADGDSVEFCLKNQLDYVSCSPYSVPMSLLTVARYYVNNQ